MASTSFCSVRYGGAGTMGSSSVCRCSSPASVVPVTVIRINVVVSTSRSTRAVVMVCSPVAAVPTIEPSTTLVVCKAMASAAGPTTSSAARASRRSASSVARAARTSTSSPGPHRPPPSRAMVVDVTRRAGIESGGKVTARRTLTRPGMRSATAAFLSPMSSTAMRTTAHAWAGVSSGCFDRTKPTMPETMGAEPLVQQKPP